jgi:AcrR family transcriptional regulator
MDRTGRPRDAGIDDAALNATFEVLSQVGYARLTLEEVARRAGTTKPSIYRRWRGKQELVLDALIRRLDQRPRVPDSGCVVCDLADGVGVFVTAFRRLPPGVLGALLADCAGKPGLRSAFMRKLFAPPREVVAEVVRRAIARGDLRAELDEGLAVDLLGSFVFYRALFGHAATDGDSVEAAVATLLGGMAADFAELTRREFGHEHNLG